jgi:hypothetical protein
LTPYFIHIVVERLTYNFAVFTDNNGDSGKRECTTGGGQAGVITCMFASSDPLDGQLVATYDPIRDANLQTGDSSHPNTFTSQNCLATNESLRVHAVLDNGMFSVIIMQFVYVASRLVCKVFVMALEMIDGIW